ncbi:MAG: hypothetical protein ACRC7O_15300 [Fimbriiglobus sp.]
MSSADETLVRHKFAATMLDVLRLPQRLRARWEEMAHAVAKRDQVAVLHAERDDYRAVFDEYLVSIGEFVSILSQIKSPLLDEFLRVYSEVAGLRNEIFRGWDTEEHLAEKLVAVLSPTMAELQEIAIRHPPPPSWYDETDDPFAPQ